MFCLLVKLGGLQGEPLQPVSFTLLSAGDGEPQWGSCCWAPQNHTQTFVVFSRSGTENLYAC